MFIRNAGTQISGAGPLNKVVTSAGGAAGVITIAAVVDKRHILHKLVWSYNTTPTGGRLTVTGGLNALDLDVSNAGPGSLSINYVCIANTAMVITIASGGGAVVGKLYIEHQTEP